MGGGRMEGGFVGLDVDGGERGQRLRGELVVSQRLLDEGDDFFGIDAAFGADAGDERARMVEQLAIVAWGVLVDAHLHLAGEGVRIAGLRKPGRMALKQDLAADQHRHHRRLGGRRIGQRPARRRIVEAAAELAVGRGGEHGDATQMIGDLAGKAVGAMMAAEQRDDLRAILRDGDHRRLAALVGERRREQADQDAGGADTDNGAAVGEEAGQQELAVFAVEAAVMHVGADQGCEACGGFGTAGGEGDDGGLHPQASSPR
jgi:hypothetical protein